MSINSKNNEEKPFGEIQLESGFFVMLFKNETDDFQEYTKDIGSEVHSISLLL